MIEKQQQQKQKEQEEEFKRKLAVLQTLDIEIKDSPYTRNKMMVQRKKTQLQESINELNGK